MEVSCPHCGRNLEVAETLAGQVVRCGVCSTLFTAPDPEGVSGRPESAPSARMDGEGGVPPGGPFPPPPRPTGPLPPVPPPAPHRPVGGAGVAAGMLISLGLLNLLWAALMSVYAVMTWMGLWEEMGKPEMPEGVGLAVFAGLALLSLGSGVLELMGGVGLARKGLAARRLAIAAAIAGLTSVWTCCFWPMAVGLCIYALVVLSARSA